jgi:hypothetical protein
MIKTAQINILEASAVSLSAGTEDTSYPLYRLYDRNVGRMFKPTVAETIEVKIDQGGEATPESIDRLIIPVGHNLAGMTLDIEHSADDVAYTPAVTQWTGAAGLINKSWSELTKRYWKFIITSPASIPELPELFLTSTYEWERNPARPTGALDEEHNVTSESTAAGQDRFLEHGDPKRQRPYHMPRCGEAQKDNIKALFEGWGGSAPFWLCDHEGDWIFGKLLAPLDLRETAHQAYSFNFDFLEVLP